jgi:hypothetical protein
MKRLQFVWCGWRDSWPPFYFVRLSPSMNIGKIYRWALYLGPLGIRCLANVEKEDA